ncbi:hypothetical protein DFJ73DRAFT_773791 [Zopfochytrium polystomum]|nr:hypothetical protein DFJ73DRAFT_773791 [Zopfochytrium polystomum]
MRLREAVEIVQKEIAVLVDGEDDPADYDLRDSLSNRTGHFSSGGSDWKEPHKYYSPGLPPRFRARAPARPNATAPVVSQNQTIQSDATFLGLAPSRKHTTASFREVAEAAPLSAEKYIHASANGTAWSRRVVSRGSGLTTRSSAETKPSRTLPTTISPSDEPPPEEQPTHSSPIRAKPDPVTASVRAVTTQGGKERPPFRVTPAPPTTLMTTRSGLKIRASSPAWDEPNPRQSRSLTASAAAAAKPGFSQRPSRFRGSQPAKRRSVPARSKLSRAARSDATAVTSSGAKTEARPPSSNGKKDGQPSLSSSSRTPLPTSTRQSAREHARRAADVPASPPPTSPSASPSPPPPKSPARPSTAKRNETTRASRATAAVAEAAAGSLPAGGSSRAARPAASGQPHRFDSRDASSRLPPRRTAAAASAGTGSTAAARADRVKNDEQTGAAAIRQRQRARATAAVEDTDDGARRGRAGRLVPTGSALEAALHESGQRGRPRRPRSPDESVERVAARLAGSDEKDTFRTSRWGRTRGDSPSPRGPSPRVGSGGGGGVEVQAVHFSLRENAERHRRRVLEHLRKSRQSDSSKRGDRLDSTSPPVGLDAAMNGYAGDDWMGTDDSQLDAEKVVGFTLPTNDVDASSRTQHDGALYDHESRLIPFVERAERVLQSLAAHLTAGAGAKQPGYNAQPEVLSEIIIQDEELFPKSDKPPLSAQTVRGGADLLPDGVGVGASATIPKDCTIGDMFTIVREKTPPPTLGAEAGVPGVIGVGVGGVADGDAAGELAPPAPLIKLSSSTLDNILESRGRYARFLARSFGADEDGLAANVAHAVVYSSERIADEVVEKIVGAVSDEMGAVSTEFVQLVVCSEILNDEHQ